MSGKDEREPIMHTRELRSEFIFKEEFESLLQKDEDTLYVELWNRMHKPGLYEVDIKSWSKSFYLGIIKSKVCPKWQSMKGKYENVVALCEALLPLVSQDVPTNASIIIVTLAVKIGLDKICQG